MMETGDTLADGVYVPIDYDEVGKLCNAVGKGRKLRAVWRQEEAWGRLM